MIRTLQWTGALALALMLAACGGEPAAADAHGDGDAHASGEDGHAAAHDQRADAHDGNQDDEHADEDGDGHAGHDEEGPPATTIAAAVAERSGIQVQPAGPGTIADEHQVQGLLTPVEGRVAEVVARFPGPIRALRVNVGDRVRAGQPLATIESNLSLSEYTVSAPIGGVVTARHAAVGGLAGEGATLFEIADLSRLWVDLHIYGADAQHIGPGVPVTVTRLGDGESLRTELERVLPGIATASQSTIARASIDNADGLWRPGSAVAARIAVAQQPVSLAVPLAALQRMDGDDVVFVREGERYEARPVEVGVRDAERAQIVRGLQAGEQVVVAESYLVKADIEKEGAAHAH